MRLTLQWMTIFLLIGASIVALPFVAAYLGISKLIGIDNEVV